MIKGSVTLRLTFYLAVATLTFTAGVISRYLADNLFARSGSVSREIQMPETPAPDFPARYCEVHGSILKAVRVQRICGEYRGGDGMGGWMHLTIGCIPGSDAILVKQVGLI